MVASHLRAFTATSIIIPVMSIINEGGTNYINITVIKEQPFICVISILIGNPERPANRKILVGKYSLFPRCAKATKLAAQELCIFCNSSRQASQQTRRCSRDQPLKAL